MFDQDSVCEIFAVVGWVFAVAGEDVLVLEVCHVSGECIFWGFIFKL